MDCEGCDGCGYDINNCNCKTKSYSEKLKQFLDEDCGADWTNCDNCPGDHYKNGACHHPDHPSMQKDKIDERYSESQD